MAAEAFEGTITDLYLPRQGWPPRCWKRRMNWGRRRTA